MYPVGLLGGHSVAEHSAFGRFAGDVGDSASNLVVVWHRYSIHNAVLHIVADAPADNFSRVNLRC
ncbi:hypothetical protein MHIB_14700 [Mycolicibacter hiberniae]|uniref:Uncharacterized protein n=1 Tax=Mycolicibacter hiberniae TaxID=29314 RepID=A0A7I7X0V0_9MYCO|nr:hypothetical protein MHIB_14700 [Mycolicibacter hiberniae]